MSDHPHTRGENLYEDQTSSASFGPSPHAWGKPHPDGDLHVGLRTIPTRVGKTSSVNPHSSHRSDHPHTRGENLHGMPPTIAAFGPSPHAWGKHHLLQDFWHLNK